MRMTATGVVCVIPVDRTERNLIILLDYGPAGNVGACLECTVSTFFPSTT